MRDPNVVITGLGCACAAGLGLEELVYGLGESSPLEPGRLGEVMDLHVEDFLSSKQNYLDRHSQLCFAAATPALQASGLVVDDDNSPQVGLAVGNSLGNQRTLEAFAETLVNKGGKYVSPFLFTHAYPNSSASLLAIEYNLKGTMVNLSAGSTSGLAAMVVSSDYLAQGASRAIVALGADAPGRLGELGETVDNDQAPPLAEGAGAVVLETSDHATGRGATVHAGITACGMLSGPVDSSAMVHKLLGKLTETLCSRGAVAPSDIDMVLVDGAPLWSNQLCDNLTVRGTACPTIAVERITGRALSASGAVSMVLAGCALSPSMDDLSSKVHRAFELDDPPTTCLVLSIETGGNAVGILMQRTGR